MKHYILRSVLSSFDEDTTRTIAIRLSERHTHVVDALERIIPTVLRAFAYKTQEGDSTAVLLEIATEANNNTWWQKALNWVPDEDRMQKGQVMLDRMLGDNTAPIANEIAHQTMIRNISAIRLMQWAAPLCLGAIGKEVAQMNYDATMLAAWLSKEPFDIDGNGFAGGVPIAVDAVSLNKNKTLKQKNKKATWWPLLLVLLFCGLLWWIFSK